MLSALALGNLTGQRGRVMGVPASFGLSTLGEDDNRQRCLRAPTRRGRQPGRAGATG